MKEITAFRNDEKIAQNLRMVNAVIKEGTTTKKQLDIIQCVISLIKPDDQNFYTQLISLDSVKKIICPSNPRTYETKKIINDAISTITESSFWILGEPEKVCYHWIEFAKVDWEKQTLKIRLSDEVKKFYLNIQKRGVIYNLKNVLSLSTLFQVRLYQWAYSKTSFHNRVSICTEDAMRLFYGEKKIKVSEFIRYLDRAVKSVNEKTDLFVAYEKVRADKSDQRRISSLKFECKSSYQKPKTQKKRTKEQLEKDRIRMKEVFGELWRLRCENDLLKEKNAAYTERIYLLEKREEDFKTPKEEMNMEDWYYAEH